MQDDAAVADVLAYYELGCEQGRLDQPLGVVEFLRTAEILLEHLPPAPAVVADIGGGPGRYALWLAERGYRVVHRDIVPLHVEQLSSRLGSGGGAVESAVADARALDLASGSADAVLLLGPLYHLYERADRLAALREARRVARPGAPVVAAAISRWAPRLHGHLVGRLYEVHPRMTSVVRSVEATGVMPPLSDGDFAGYCHRPEGLGEEVRAAGLVLEDLVSVEGLAFALPDLEERVSDPHHLQAVLDAARATQRVPELLGLGPHLIAVGRRSSTMRRSAN